MCALLIKGHFKELSMLASIVFPPMAMSPAVNLVMKLCVLTSNCDNKACCSSSIPPLRLPSVERVRFAQAAMTTFQERRRPRRAILRQLAQLGRKMTLEEDDTRWIPPLWRTEGLGQNAATETEKSRGVKCPASRR